MKNFVVYLAGDGVYGTTYNIGIIHDTDNDTIKKVSAFMESKYSINIWGFEKLPHCFRSETNNPDIIVIIEPVPELL